jgi:hypothetical protein
LSSVGLPRINPAHKDNVPSNSGSNEHHATSREAGILLPTNTGSICCIAPNMTDAMNPNVMQCVAASMAGECALENGWLSASASIAAASIRNSGASAKKLNGMVIGGDWSVLSEAIFMRREK